MAEGSYGKETKDTSSSYVPLNTHSRKQPIPKDIPKKQPGTPESSVPRKPINLLKMQDPTYKKISRKDLLEILMRQPTPDARKSIVVDVESDTDEIDEAYDSIRKESLPLQKRMFL